MPNKVNKGEWAELFVFLKALAEGKIYSADENLEKVEKSFYVILSAIKQEGAINKEYKRIEFTNKVLLLVNNLECIEIPYEEFDFLSNCS